MLVTAFLYKNRGHFVVARMRGWRSKKQKREIGIGTALTAPKYGAWWTTPVPSSSLT
jgi:hypothetical protein